MKSGRALLDWSARYHHLREVTCDDIVAIRDGFRPANNARASSSRCGHCSGAARRPGAIFRNPTARRLTDNTLCDLNVFRWAEVIRQACGELL
jgi:hypothetical protein